MNIELTSGNTATGGRIIGTNTIGGVDVPDAVVREDAHLSFSSLNQFAQCPRSWYSKRVLGKKEPTTDVAAFGSTFDQAVAYKLGLTKPGSDPLSGDAPEVEEMRNAVSFYFDQAHAWKEADSAQEPIRIEPSQWGTLADEYGACGDIHLPLIGYIDLYRQRGVERSICDLKTSTRSGFQATWALQTLLYALAKRARTCEIHQLVKLSKGYKLNVYRFFPNDSLYRWAMTWAGVQADGIRKAQEASSIDRFAANPGFYCAWCPERIECPAASFDTLSPLGGGESGGTA